MSLSGYDGIFRYGPALPDHLVAATSVPDRSGETVSLYDAYGRHRETRSTRTNGLLKSFEYSGGHRLKAIIDGFGNRTTIERDSQGDPTAIVAPFGQRTELTVGAGHLLSSVVKPGGAETSITYDSGGLMKTFSMPNGATSQFTYDPDGRLTRDEDALGGHLDLAKTGSPDDFSVEISSDRGRIRTNRVEKLSDGTIRRTIDSAKSGTSTRVQSADGSVSESTATGSLTESNVADSRFGAAVQMPSTATGTTPGGLTTSTRVEDGFDLKNVFDPSSWGTQSTTFEINGSTWTSEYTKSSNVAKVRSPEGREISMSFNAKMQPVSESVAGVAATTITHDGAGRSKSIRTGDRVTSYEYDARGNLASETDAGGNVTEFTYDSADKMIAKRLPGNRTIEYGFDTSGNMISITPPSRPAHETLFDLLGQPTALMAPAGPGPRGATVFEYGGEDNELTQITKPSGRVTQLSYDDAGRVAAIHSGGADQSFEYDVDSGLPTRSVSEFGQTAEISYDGSLPTGFSQSGEVAGNTSVSYNNFTKPAQINSPNHETNLTYDRDLLLKSAGDLDIQRDSESGLITGSTLGNTSSGAAYNEYAEPLTNVNEFANGGIYNESFTRNALGRITEKAVETSDGVDRIRYAYDGANRLVGVSRNGEQESEYTYDANSNRLSTTYGAGPNQQVISASFDDRDRMTTYGDLALSYNEDGELVEKRDTAVGASTTFSYSVFGALKTAELSSGVSVNYAYDGLGNLVSKKTNGELSRAFLYAPGILGPVTEIDGAGDPVASFVYATHFNVPDYMVKRGRTFRLITDQVGSVRLVVDADTGSVEQAINYDAFGRVLSDSNPGFQPFGFGGGIYDGDTKLTHFGSREYDAELGRWTSPDPISFAGGDSNLYGYVLADPVNNVDPDGLFLREVGNFLVGIGDGGTIGGTKWVRENVLHVYGGVDTCSGSYQGGQLVGIATTSYLAGAGAVGMGTRYGVEAATVSDLARTRALTAYYNFFGKHPKAVETAWTWYSNIRNAIRGSGVPLP